MFSFIQQTLVEHFYSQNVIMIRKNTETLSSRRSGRGRYRYIKIIIMQCAMVEIPREYYGRRKWGLLIQKGKIPDGLKRSATTRRK